MFSGLDTLLQAAQFLELQEQQQQPPPPPPPHRLNSDVSIIPTNSSRSVNMNSGSSSNSSINNSTISFIPSNSTSISESRFLPPIGKISNGTVILTAAGSQNGSTRILAAPMNGTGSTNTTTTALVTGLVPQGTTAYLTTTTTTNGSAAGSSRLHPTGTATIVPVISGGGSRKRTISNASNHSSGGYGKDEPILNGHSSSTAPPLVVISTSSSGNSNSNSNGQLLHQKHHPPALTIDLSTKSSSHHVPHHQQRLSSTPPSASSGCSSSSTSSTLTISPVDDSQSSLNLSGGSTTSGYVTSHSANSSSSLNLNLSGSPPSGCLSSSSSTSSASSTSSHGSNSSPLPHDLVIVQQHQQQSPLGISQLTSTATLLGHVPTGGRRRTTSSNSNGVGTREVHNKLEKNRRAHLKECFEQLKKQLTLQPDEKKTSNLSILHAAIRHIQVLKRKEREYEHEMERLAKEKIAAQNRILLLKRELSQWGDVDFSRLAPDTDAIPNGGSSTSSLSLATSNGLVQADRDLLNDPPGSAPGGRNGMRYSSSSSLSSVATTASIGNLPLQTTISPVLVAASSSPTRASPPSVVTSRSTSSPASMPLSLTTKPGQEQLLQNGTSPLKLNGLNGTTTTTNGTPLPLIVGANNLSALGQSQLFTPVTTILTTGNGSTIQTLPLNLNVTPNGHHHHHSSPQNGLITSTASGLQIIGTSSAIANPLSTSVVTNGKELINGSTAKNGLRTSDGGNKIEIIATQTTAGSALEPPATKVIKLVNGSTLVGLTPMDKDKMMLSQVVQQGGIVVSPIQLLTSTQGLRVIQQAPNGLATIELSSPTNVQSQSSQVHRTTGGNNGIITNAPSTVPQHLSSSQTIHLHQQQPPHQIQQVTGAQLHKLLLSSAAAASTNGTSSNSTTINGTTATVVSTTSITPELARLPGGAELNILAAGSNGTTTALPLYRTTAGGPQQGKLTFVNAIAAAAGNGTGLTLKGTDTAGTGRAAVHVVTPVQTGQLSSLTPVVVSRYDHHLHHQDAAGLFTTATAAVGPSSGKVGALLSRN